MADTQKNIINAEEIGYMSYNKLNIFITILLLGFSITFAVLGDRVEQDAMWWGIILLLLPLLTLAPTSIKNLGAVVVDAVTNNFTIFKNYISNLKTNNDTIFKISIGILSLITTVCIFLLAFNVSFWFFLFFVPPLYFLLKVVYTYENSIRFAAIISIISIGGIGHLLFPLSAVILDVILAMFLLARFTPGFTTLIEFIRDNKRKSITLLLSIVAFGITLNLLT